MSSVDFNQEARDQGCLHIAVKSIGGASSSLFKAVEKVLRDMPPVQPPEPKGTVLFLRFIDGGKPPCWAEGEAARGRARWDQFSAHKSVLGLVCVAVCHDADDLDNIRAGYRDACRAHKATLCGSKCILYGPRKNLESCTELTDGLVHIDSTLDELDVLVEDVKPPIVEKIASELAQSILLALRGKMETCLKLVGDPSRTDPLPYLRAPVETKETTEEELEQR